MKIFIISGYTGKINEMDLPVTRKQIDRWKAGERLRDVMPHLSPVERIFLKTGMSEAEQLEYYQHK